MEPSHCRELLARLIADESATLKELEALLEREHRILLRNEQPEALEEACAARQICMGTLLRIQEERRGVLRALGLRAEPQGFGALLDYCEADLALRSRWSELGVAAQRCRELNDRNGALVQSRIRRVEGMLEILTGRRQGGNVYAAPGAPSAPRTSGQLLAARA